MNCYSFVFIRLSFGNKCLQSQCCYEYSFGNHLHFFFLTCCDIVSACLCVYVMFTVDLSFFFLFFFFELPFCLTVDLSFIHTHIHVHHVHAMPEDSSPFSPLSPLPTRQEKGLKIFLLGRQAILIKHYKFALLHLQLSQIHTSTFGTCIAFTLPGY